MTRKILILVLCLAIALPTGKTLAAGIAEQIRDFFKTQTIVDTSTLAVQNDNYKICGPQKLCVPHFLCNEKHQNTTKDGLALINLQNTNNDCEYLEVCCSVQQTIKANLTVTKTKPTTDIGCGYRNSDGVKFKCTGDLNNETEFGEFPWMTAVLKNYETKDEILHVYNCGGVILTPKIILTAAHCVEELKAENLLIRAGEWDINTKNEGLPHQDRQVTEVVIHEKYNPNALYYDIALLVVTEPFNFIDNVHSICLSEPQKKLNGTQCFATGWGKRTFGKKGKYQHIMKKVELSVVQSDHCENQLQTTRLGRYFELHESFICAGGLENIDTCTGDGGSPLVCSIDNENKRYYLAGLVSWGIGCGEKGLPGIYVNIPYLRTWLNTKLTERGADSRYYLL